MRHNKCECVCLNLGEGGDADSGAAEGEGRAAVAREPEARVQRRHLPGRRRNKDEGLEFELERAVSLVRSALLGRMFKLLFIATAEPHPDSSNRESTPTAAWGYSNVTSFLMGQMKSIPAKEQQARKIDTMDPSLTSLQSLGAPSRGP